MMIFFNLFLLRRHAFHLLTGAVSLFLLIPLHAEPETDEKVIVKVFYLPSKQGVLPRDVAAYRVLEQFRQKHPNIILEGTTALRLVDENQLQDIAPLMAIAGGTSPDIISVNFRKSETYINQKFLYPLDEYVEKMSPEEFAERVPSPVLPVIYRDGPGGKPHYWAIPEDVNVGVLEYRRDLFAAAGLDPDHPPQNWEELHEFARKLADPSRGIYGLSFRTGNDAAWSMNAYLSSAGAQAVKQLPDGQWQACFDSEEAITAYEFVDMLQKDVVTKNGVTGNITYRGPDAGPKFVDEKVAMDITYLQSNDFVAGLNLELIGIAAVPKGRTGISSSQLNSRLLGIFAGQKDKRIRDAAWEYIRFVGSREAQEIYTHTFVELGATRAMNPKRLRQFGYFHLASLVPKNLEEAFDYAMAHGTPEPYGKNCQFIYNLMSGPMDQIFYDKSLQKITKEERRKKIKAYLTAAVQKTNEKLIGIIPEAERKKRDAVAWIVAVLVMVVFITIIWRVFHWMNQLRPPILDAPASYKMRLASMLIAPALLLILTWQYYPLFRGSSMAFQNYSVIGESPWVGISNFADVLFDGRFWIALKNAFYFCSLWMLMGFLPPMLLAIMLQEIPKGKILFRLLFYLPAVVSGVVILFMWRGIYDPSPNGILNQMLVLFFGKSVHTQTWLQDPEGIFSKILGLLHLPSLEWLPGPSVAMLCVVFPLAWAHLGPGCIIYLAALKGVPDELYEAADIDGASFFGKLRYVVFPYLKPLIVINAVGAIIFGFKSSDAILAMTGGGPNLATHVIGYEIWERSFMFLKFGQGTAMAWILGVLLLSFTAYQLKILSKVEFRTANR